MPVDLALMGKDSQLLKALASKASQNSESLFRKSPCLKTTVNRDRELYSHPTLTYICMFMGAHSQVYVHMREGERGGDGGRERVRESTYIGYSSILQRSCCAVILCLTTTPYQKLFIQ